MSCRRPSNSDVVKALREMALFLEMDEVPFKHQAYEKAAYAVAALDQPLSKLYAEGGEQALDALPAIGKGIAQRIAQMPCLHVTYHARRTAPARYVLLDSFRA